MASFDIGVQIVWLRNFVVFFCFAFLLGLVFPEHSQALRPFHAAPFFAFETNADQQTWLAKRKKRKKRKIRRKKRPRKGKRKGVRENQANQEQTDDTTVLGDTTWAQEEQIELPDTPQQDSFEIEDEETTFHNAWLALQLGANIGGRRFAYSGSRSPELHPYQMPFAMLPLHLQLHVFPMSSWDDEMFLSDLGVRCLYTRALGLRSKMQNGPEEKLETKWSNWKVGLVQRLSQETWLLLFGLDMGGTNFEVVVPEGHPLKGQIQNIGYRYVRPSIDARFTVDAWSLLGGMGFRYVFSTGPFEDFFPNAFVWGFDLELGGAVQLFDFLELNLVGNYEHYLHSLKPTGDADFVAQNASDIYYTILFGGTLLF